MRAFQDHAQRRALTDELHARPFSPLAAPAEIMHLALAPETRPAERDRDAEHAHLAELLAHLGQQAEPAAAADSNHRLVVVGDLRVKWERHTEFVTYTLTRDAAPEPPFTPALLERLPSGWLDRAPGKVISASLTCVAAAAGEDDAEQAMEQKLAEFFSPDSLAAAWVSDRQALAMSDFRIDAAGFTRFALIALPDIAPRRLGRIAQRLIELETYRSLAMLTLPLARRAGPRLLEIERDLAEVIQGVAQEAEAESERRMLGRLTALAAELERIAADGAFRFGAARAYETIVNDRIQALREERVAQRQTFQDFMVRRFKPALRTCRSAEERLRELAERAGRAADLLRTRVDVTLTTQNQELLHSMNRRAQLQLRLQETVEGLSVVAISYYAVSLAGYLLAPLGGIAGLDDKHLKALAVAPVVLAVWLFVRRLRRHARDEG